MNLVKRYVIKYEKKLIKHPLDRSFWTTKDRQDLMPQDFNDKHLEATIAFIEKGAVNYYYMEEDQKHIGRYGNIHKNALAYLKNKKLYQLLIAEKEKREKKAKQQIIPAFLKKRPF